MSISEELQQLCESASFTIADMALWCGFDRSVIRQWLTGEHKPHRIREKHLLDRMALLRLAVEKSGKLPVPVALKSYDRPKYVEQVRDYALKELFKANFTGTGCKNMDQHS